MDPHRRTVPGGLERRFPDFRGSLRIDLALQEGNRPARLGVIGRQRPATTKVVRSGPRSIRRVDALQGDEKLREAGGEVAQIAYALRERPSARYGLTALCVGMGMGAALLWERV